MDEQHAHEATSLLHSHIGDDEIDDALGYSENDFCSSSTDWKDHLKPLLELTWPLSLALVLEQLPYLIGIGYVGNLGTGPVNRLHLASVAIASSYSVIFALSIGLGMASAMDTLCSQAYGAGKAKQMGVYLQRGILITGLVFIPTCFLMAYAGPILLLLGQPADVASAAQSYCRVLIWGLPFFVFYELLRRVLQAQGIVLPMLVISILTNVVCVLTCEITMKHLGMGYIGAAISRNCASMFMVLALMIYVLASEQHKVFWAGWSMSALRGWYEWLALALPGMAMVFFEWSALEGLCFIAGYLPSPHVSLAAHTVIFNSSGVIFMHFFGVGLATSITVGNLLGRNESEAARTSFLAATVIAVISGAVVVVALLLLGAPLIQLMVESEAVRRLAMTSMPIVAIYQLPESVTQSSFGALRGMGKQMHGFVVGTVFYWLGWPMSYYLGVTLELNLPGVWWGMATAMMVATLAALGVSLLSDWDAIGAAIYLRLCEESRAASKANSPRGRRKKYHDDEDEDDV